MSILFLFIFELLAAFRTQNVTKERESDFSQRIHSFVVSLFSFYCLLLFPVLLLLVFSTSIHTFLFIYFQSPYDLHSYFNLPVFYHCLPLSSNPLFPSHIYSHPLPLITITHFNTAFYSQHIYFCSVMPLCSSILTPISRATVQQVTSVNGGAFGDKACSFASGCCLLCN